MASATQALATGREDADTDNLGIAVDRIFA